MLFNSNLKIAIRNIVRNKLFSFINIIGLTIGITTCLVILLFVKQELSYDKYHNDHEQIYRVGVEAKLVAMEVQSPVTAPPLSRTLKQDYSEVIQSGRIYTHENMKLVLNDVKYLESRCYSIDSTMLNLFRFNFISGSAKDFQHHNSAILTKSIAKKYFSNFSTAIGKSLKIDDELFNVVAIVEDAPVNTHFKYNILLNLARLRIANKEWWLSDNVTTYVKVSSSTDRLAFQDKIQNTITKYIKPSFEKMNVKFNGDNYYRFIIEPLADLHFSNKPFGEFEINSDILYVKIFIIVGIFILLIACINFSNLSTALATKRSKEIGVKKSLGSKRSSIMMQFFSESISISLMALVLSIIILETLLPTLNGLLGLSVENSMYSEPSTLLMFIGISIVAGVMAGLYSALYMSSFNPMTILRGTFKTGNKSKRFRSILVVVQFTVSIFLIISTLIVKQQIDFIKSKDLGFNKENLLIMRNVELPKNIDGFKEKLLLNPAVKNITFSSDLPGVFGNGNAVNKCNSDDKNSYSVRIPYVDYNFMKTMNVNMVQGRFFDESKASDMKAVILNESSVKNMNLTEPLGKKFKSMGDGSIYHVIGVMKDYHSVSLHTDVSDMFMSCAGNKSRVYDNVAIRLNSGYNTASLNYIKSVWKEFSNNSPFVYNFLEDDMYNLHKTEDRTMKVFSMFSILAIIIACLGLFGLVSFTTEQRIKEIGIRKVLGGSVFSIISIVNKDIIRLIALSYLLSCVAAWYLMSQWLQGFKYKIDLSLGSFILAGAVIFVLTVITISKIALKAANQNPVKALKYE